MPKLKPLLFLFIAITILTMLTNVPCANSQPTPRWESEYENAYSLAQAEAEKQGLLVGELIPISEGSPSFYRYAWLASFMDNVTGSYAKVSVIRTQYYNIEKRLYLSQKLEAQLLYDECQVLPSEACEIALKAFGEAHLEGEIKGPLGLFMVTPYDEGLGWSEPYPKPYPENHRIFLYDFYVVNETGFVTNSIQVLAKNGAVRVIRQPLPWKCATTRIVSKQDVQLYTLERPGSKRVCRKISNRGSLDT